MKTARGMASEFHSVEGQAQSKLRLTTFTTPQDTKTPFYGVNSRVRKATRLHGNFQPKVSILFTALKRGSQLTGEPRITRRTMRTEYGVRSTDHAVSSTDRSPSPSRLAILSLPFISMSPSTPYSLPLSNIRRCHPTSARVPCRVNSHLHQCKMELGRVCRTCSCTSTARAGSAAVSILHLTSNQTS